jgi:hypothetical protein
LRKKNYTRENLSERDQFKDLDVDGRKILKGIFKKWVGEAWTESIWLRILTALVNDVMNFQIP